MFKILYADFNDDDAICGFDLGKMLEYQTGGSLPEKVKQRIIKNVSKCKQGGHSEE